MASGTFETTDFAWKLQQVQQRLSEGLERFFARNSQTDSILPNWQIPNWLQPGVFWLIVLGLIGWASWQLWLWLRPYVGGFGAFNQPLNHKLSPPPLTPNTLSIADWLKRSHRAQQQGNYREACRSIYMAALQQLHDTDLVHQEPSRTDGEYLRLIQDLPSATAYQTLLRVHEQVCFSDAAVSADLFDRCWHAYREIENLKT